MKKQTKKILLSMGAITTTITPIFIALSCGSKTDQQKMNGITSDMVKSALNVTPSSTTLPSATTKPSTKTNVTLNGLAGVTITISDVKPDDDKGTLTATAAISKTGLTPPTGSPFTITWSGYQTTTQHEDQKKMDGITSDMVKSALNVTPSSTTLPSAATQPTTTTDVTLNGLAGVTITISDVKPDDDKGTLTATAAISKTGLTSPTGSPFTIIWSGYQTQNMHDQILMNGITSDMVKSALNVTPSSTTLPSVATKPATKIATLNGLTGVTITISGVTPNDDKGTLIATANISKTGLNPPTGSPFTITWSGYQTQYEHDQILMNGITSDMVKSALNITPSSTTLPSAATKPATKIATLNGLAGVTITISDVKPDDDKGTLTATANISKTGLNPPTGSPFTITWSGYQTQNMHDQILMDGITSDMVKSALNVTPSSTTLPSAATQPTTTTDVTLNGLAGVTITISDVKPDDDKGTLTATAAISKTGLTSPTGSPFTIIWSGYKTQNMHDQILMNGITSDMVKSALNVTPSSTTLPSAATKPATKIATLNGLTGVTITVSHVTPDDDNGTLTATANISKTGLNPPTGSPFTITWSGYQTTTQHEDQKKMDGITSDMVKSALNVTPSSTTLPSAATQPTTTTDVTLNGLAGVTITISDVKPDDDKGILTATADISKTGLNPPTGSPFTITWSGYQTQIMHDQILMNGITIDMVKTALGITPSTTTPSAAATKLNAHKTRTATLNGLAGVTITISGVTPNDNDGTLTATADISKGILIPSIGSLFTITWSGFARYTLSWTPETVTGFPSDVASDRSILGKINATTLLVGTNNNGFYKVDISNPNWVWTHLSVFGINVANEGSIIKVDDNNFFVASGYRGFYKVNISSPIWTWTQIFTDSSPAAGQLSAIIKIASNKFLLASASDYYIVDTSTSTWTEKIISNKPANASARGSSLCLIDNNNVLVGTSGNGFYKVDFSQSTPVWTHITEISDDNSRGSSIFKLDNQTLLVGTAKKGFYWVDISQPTWVWRKVNNTNAGLTDASGEWSQISKINDDVLLVSTYDKGFFEVNIKTKGKEFWIPLTQLKITITTDNVLSKALKISDNEFLVPTSQNGFYRAKY